MYRIRTLTKDVQENIINITGLITFSALKQIEVQNLFTVLSNTLMMDSYSRID